MTPSILALVVLYNRTPQESQTVLSLRKAAGMAAAQRLRIKIILVDNSPGEQHPPSQSGNELYLSFPDNPGLAHAYNLGLDVAQREGFEWLLTLDQDTCLPGDFFVAVYDLLTEISHDSMIGSVMPQLFHGSRIISPYFYRNGFLPEWFPKNFRGVPEVTTFALNSASIVRVDALTQAGGYDPAFWLDASDHIIFARLAALGKKVLVAGNIQIQHTLSVLESTSSLPLQRASNMLVAESAFHDLWLSSAAGLFRNAILLVRAMRSLLRGHAALAKLTFSHVIWRLMHSRTRRLHAWQATSAQRSSSMFRSGGAEKISVCMAAYNGSRFIDEQIRSVLSQLPPRGELVIVDDASTNDLPARVQAIGDPRIRLIRQQKAQGVLRTVEHALRAATGDILFLCDGDDLWADHTVAEMLRAFNQNPKALVVLAGTNLLDEQGGPIVGSAYLDKREFTNSVVSNLVRNMSQGCVMAIRSSLLEQVLPFPEKKAFLHDDWIALVNRVTGGEAAYVPHSLPGCPRHTSNVSNPLSLSRGARARFQLAVALLNHMVRRVAFGPMNQRARVALIRDRSLRS